MIKGKRLFYGIGMLFGFATSISMSAAPKCGVALYGEQDLKYDWSKDKHFNYVNPNAPKGGRLRIGSIGGANKLNPFTLKGTSFAYVSSLVFESLLEASADLDESFSNYSSIAEKVEVAADRSYITYWIDPDAKFSDGVKITADDVLFSFNILQDPGALPFYRNYYSEVERVEKINDLTVRFHLSNKENQELALITGQLPILPKHIYGVAGKSFGDDFMNVAIGSGPYIIEEGYNLTTHLTFKKNPEWWARNKPAKIGHYNFDRIEFKFYQTTNDIYDNVKLINKRSRIDIAFIGSAGEWSKGFNNRLVRNNWLIKDNFVHNRLPRMQCFFLNTRRPIFKELCVRKAICAAMDFDKMNRDLFFGQYNRQITFWDNNEEMASRGPAEGKVLDNLKELAKQYGEQNVPQSSWLIGPSVYDKSIDGKALPMSDIIAATNYYLKSHGWVLPPGKLVREKNGVQLSFEFLLYDASWGRIIEPMRVNLSRMGIKCNTRVVQPAEFVQKLKEFDYDTLNLSLPLSSNPGNELIGFFTSKSASIPSSWNVAGITNPAIDDVVAKITSCKNREDLIMWTQVLDRILCAQQYVIPQWYSGADRMVHWRYLKYPENLSWKVDYPEGVFRYWWYDEAEAKRLREAIRKNEKIEDDKVKAEQ